MQGVKYIAWLARDCHGNSCQGVVDEEADCVQVCGLQNPQGYGIYFEAELHHLKKWCEENGVELIKEEGWHLFRATFCENEVGLEIIDRHGDKIEDDY